MADEYIPSKAEHLANVLSGNASTAFRAETVQRSHRFLLHQFVVIENMAKMADCSVAAMINQVIDVGMEAIYEHLTPELATQMYTLTQNQIDKSGLTINQKVGKYKAKK